MKFRDLTGQTFGRWTVLDRAENRCGRAHWNCVCECGAMASVASCSLTLGKSVSCGCFNVEGTIERCFSHGHANGGNGTRTYNCWRNMKARCQNPNNHKYPIYGGRGITICAEWQSFDGFLADMGECPSIEYSIDRIDNDGNYDPGNCRWATVSEQMNNQSTNTRLTFNGRTQTLVEWARETGINPPTISRRINSLGWSVEKALTEHVHLGRH